MIFCRAYSAKAPETAEKKRAASAACEWRSESAWTRPAACSRIEHELITAKESLIRLPSFFAPHAFIDLALFYKNYDLLICQIAFLRAMLDYDRSGGKSRGSYLLYDREGSLPHPRLEEMFRFSIANSALAGQVQEISYNPTAMQCQIGWRSVRPIPKTE